MQERERKRCVDGYLTSLAAEPRQRRPGINAVRVSLFMVAADGCKLLSRITECLL